MLPTDYACPRCKCQACYALHRKGFDWVISLVGLRPARCLTCNKRFYARYTMADSERQPGKKSRARSDADRYSHTEEGARKPVRNLYPRDESDEAA